MATNPALADRAICNAATTGGRWETRASYLPYVKEAKHGMFSYFLMKGMEGDADANQDNQITAGELHAYVQQNVIQQSSGARRPNFKAMLTVCW